MYILHNLVCSTCTANPQLHCFLIKTVCLRVGSIFQGLIFFLFVFVNDINAWILREPGYCGIWPSIRGSASFSCVICFLSLVFIQTSFLMKYFLECRQFIMIVTQMSHRLVNLLGLDINYYRFFQSGWSTLLYNVFARGCIYHVYPIACFCMYIYLTCILIKDMKWLSPLYIRCRYCDLFFSLKETFLEFWKY